MSGKTKNPTVTSIFMVPTLNIDKNKLKGVGFIDGFIRDKNKDADYENVVYLLFHPPNMDAFMGAIDEEYERNSGIIEDYDYEGGYVVLVYGLNKDYEKDFKLIKKGKYSHTSEEFQNLFPETAKVEEGGQVVTKKSIQYRIFNKTTELVEYWEKKTGFDFKDDMELWPIWEEEKETLDIDKIKELV